MNLETNNLVISQGHKKRIFQWEIPHLIWTLKKEQGLAFTHLDEMVDFPPGTTDSFVFNGHTGFPLFAGVESLGLLLCFNSLTDRRTKHVRQQIDSYLKKALLKIMFSKHKKEMAFSFPLLLKGEKPSAVLKKAHKIYLKTPSFAFVNTDDLKWKKDLFKDMSGVFVLIPFFQHLSLDQKQMLEQALFQKNLPGWLVMGLSEKDTLPKDWPSFFHSTI